MHRRWIEYSQDWRTGPMTFWVHKVTTDGPWSADVELQPPRPSPIAGRGYPYYFVEFDGMVFEFASLDELRECISVLARKLLPNTRDLSVGRGAGPNSHWLSRLPSFAKPWSFRQPACAYLEKCLDEFLKGA